MVIEPSVQLLSQLFIVKKVVMIKVFQKCQNKKKYLKGHKNKWHESCCLILLAVSFKRKMLYYIIQSNGKISILIAFFNILYLAWSL